MSFASWILAGLLVGLAAGRLSEGYGLVEDVIVGVVGAVVAGWLFVQFTGTPVTVLAPADLFAAFVGSCVFVAIVRTVARGHPAI